MPRGSVRRTRNPPLSGDVEGTAWERAEPLAIDQFPWYRDGRKQATTGRLVYDDRALYLQFRAEDRHCSATVTELNGAVYEDSCVEFFASPEPADSSEYVNVEANCCGTMLVGFGTPGDRRLIDRPLADRITIETSIEGPTTSGPPPGDSWWLAAELPYDVLEDFTGLEIAPESGTTWRGNLYRCGGEVDPQYAAWSAIDAPEPDFHRPEAFGTLVFE